MYRSITGVTLAAALALAACAKAPATAQVDGATQVASAKAAVPMVDGKPMWSSTKTYTAQQNAARAFSSNGAAFGAADVDAYVKIAHSFVDHPPSGAKTLKRANGDTLIYDEAANTFAVASSDGVPRTLFKPREGTAYWQEQVASGGESRTSTAAAKAKSSADAST